MAVVPSIISGASARLVVDGVVLGVAEVQFDRRIDHVPVNSLGESSPLTAEAMRFIATGQFRIQRYNKLPVAGPLNAALNSRANQRTNSNSLAGANSRVLRLSPREMLLTRTFDLEVDAFLPQQAAAGTTLGRLLSVGQAEACKGIIRFTNCRINNLTVQGGVGAIVTESYSFMATGVELSYDAFTGSPLAANDAALAQSGGSYSQFMSSPKIHVRLGGKTLALAVGFGFNVPIMVEPVFAMGSLSPLALEPLGFGLVSGQLQLSRAYPSAIRQFQIQKSNERYGDEASSSAPFLSVANTIISPDESPELASHLNPLEFLLARTVDLEIVVDYPKSASTAGLYTAYTVQDVKLTSDSGMVAYGQVSSSSLAFVGRLAEVNDVAPSA